MPQQPAALLPDTGLSTQRPLKSIPAAVEGEGAGPRENRFGAALRESQAALNDASSGDVTADGGNEVRGEPLPGDGKTLPPAEVVDAVEAAALSVDAGVADIGPATPDEKVVGGEGPGQLLTGLETQGDGTEQPAISALRDVGPGMGSDILSASQILDEQGAMTAAVTATAVGEGGRPVAGADGREVRAAERVFEIALGRRGVNSPQAGGSDARPDDGAALLRDPAAAVREIALDNARRDQNFTEALSSRLTAEAAGRFVNVSGMTQAEGVQQVSPLGNPQAALQPASDKSAMTASLPMDAPLQSREWKEEFGERVRWLINQKMQTAELKINPPQLGSVEIRIHVQNEQVSIQFQTAHAMVKDTLEDSLPRLREILNGSGLDLVDVDVAQHSETGGREAGNETGSEREERLQDRMLSQEEGEQAPLETDVILRQGMVDMYA